MRKIGIFYFFCFAALVVFCIKTPVQAQEPTIPKTDLGTALKDFSQLNDSNKNMILTAIGLPQANDFDLFKILAYIIFGAVGFVAFIYGKKNAFWRSMIIGLTLMAYPYFLSGTLAIYLVGIALSAALYFWRE